MHLRQYSVQITFKNFTSILCQFNLNPLKWRNFTSIEKKHVVFRLEMVVTNFFSQFIENKMAFIVCECYFQMRQKQEIICRRHIVIFYPIEQYQ